MAATVYGTRKFFGLDSQTAKHLLDDGELTLADNVNFDTHGAVKPELTDVRFSGAAAANISGIGVGTIDGVTHVFYKAYSVGDGEYIVYRFAGQQTAQQIPGTWGAGTLRAYQGDNVVVLVDGTNMRVWDGNILRKLGPVTAGTGFGAEAGVVVEKREDPAELGYQYISRMEWDWDVDDGGGPPVQLASPGDLFIKHRQTSGVPDPHVLNEGQLFRFSLMKYYFIISKDGDVSPEVMNYILSLRGKTLKASLNYIDEATPIPDTEWFRATHIVDQDANEDPIIVPGTGGQLYRAANNPPYERSIGGYTPMSEYAGPVSCMLTGRYKYGVVYVLELPDGRELESRFIPISGAIDSDEDDATGDPIDAFDLEPKDVVLVVAPKVTETDFEDYVLDDGTAVLGTDLNYKIRIYRTKMDGESFYVLAEFDHEDAYDDTDPETDPDATGVHLYDSTPDLELGALYIHGQGKREAPVLFSDAVVSSNRIYAINEADRRDLHFSFVGDMDYWNPLDFVQFPEALTAVSSMPGFVAAFSATRCWLYDNDDGVGYLVEIPVEHGVQSQDSVLSLSSNVYFANGMGLFELSGSRVRNVARPVEDEWRSAHTGSWAGVALGSKMIWSPGVGRAFVIKLSDDGIRWARTDQPDGAYYQRMVADPSVNRVIAQMDDGVYVFGSGSEYKTLGVRSKDYGSGVLGVARRLTLDASGDIDGYAWVMSNYHPEPEPIKITGKGGARRLAAYNLKTMQGEFWSLAFTGTGELYGWMLEVDEHDSSY
jgi:hypothetical protein